MSPRDRPPPPPPEPLPAPVVDSHCHLEMADAQIAELIDAAEAANVTRMVTVGDTVASSLHCVQTAERHPQVVAAVAVHPNESGDFDDESYRALDEMARHPRVRAIGETGLDYYWDRVTPAVQQRSFRRHIELAKAHDLPVVIHDRDAHADVLAVLEEVGAPRVTVFHCFSGDERFARDCVERGFVLSFAGTVTFKNAPELRAAARVVPAGQLMVETDAPFLTPHPFRGAPNAPAMVAHTVRLLAHQRGESVEELCAHAEQTALRVFGDW